MLEAIARAIPKSCFVGFDPAIDNAFKAGKPIPDDLQEKAARRREVLARAEERPAGLPGHLARLFPDEFEESELGWIPKGWRAVTLDNVVEILDSRRVPLSSRQRAERQGRYPYYGAAGVLDYVDDYLFEGVHVLLGEDGSVVDDNGFPFVQYVWGRFWVNNHAHVLRGRNGICNEYLYLFLKQINIQPFVTGAVQPKLNQQNMKAIPFLLPSMSVCNIFSQHMALAFERLRVSTDHAKTLAAIRDTLLPKLISGELRVKNIEKFLGGNV
ncbi:MAG: restriction endonuclease subunit S [Firmicutes bacterium]|nr:restriction endonuclease subunit S [Bacillota bacterium]